VDAIERISYEFCKSQSEQGIIYTEVRYTPHYFLKRSFTTNSALSPVTTRSIVEAVSRGLERGQQDFNVTVRSILTCRRGDPDWCQDILQLATEFKDRGVVGIDVTGNALDPDVSRFRDGTYHSVLQLLNTF
jgi:adenosine deaminase